MVPVRGLADRFSEAAAACRSLTELRLLLVDAASELGFRYVALLHHSALADPRYPLRLDNYPEEWVRELIEHRLIDDDPVHLASSRTAFSFEWAELDRLLPLGRRQLQILERSRHHGIGEGLTVPVNVPGEPAGSCSFALALGSELPRDRLICAGSVGVLAFAAARRLAGLPAAAPRPHLSRREVQCLRLVAAGKSDWEIGVILGISVETARQYLKRARLAYGVVTRAQLVALALRDHWLDFEDALKPRP